MSVDDVVKIITVLSAFFSPILLAYITYLTVRAKESAKEAKKEVAEVKTTLAVTTTDTATKLDDLKTQGEGIHSLVNSQLTAALDHIDDLQREIAELKVHISRLTQRGG